MVTCYVNRGRREWLIITLYVVVATHCISPFLHRWHCPHQALISNFSSCHITCSQWNISFKNFFIIFYRFSNMNVQFSSRFLGVGNIFHCAYKISVCDIISVKSRMSLINIPIWHNGWVLIFTVTIHYPLLKLKQFIIGPRDIRVKMFAWADYGTEPFSNCWQARLWTGSKICFWWTSI